MATTTGATAWLRQFGRRLVRTGWTIDEIADHVGCHRRRVQFWLHEEGLRANKQLVIGPTHEETLRLIQMRLTDKDAAKMAGVSTAVFKNRRHRLGLRCGRYERKQPNKPCKLKKVTQL